MPASKASPGLQGPGKTPNAERGREWGATIRAPVWMRGLGFEDAPDGMIVNEHVAIVIGSIAGRSGNVGAAQDEPPDGCDATPRQDDLVPDD
jgi:hypothetical protein